MQQKSNLMECVFCVVTNYTLCTPLALRQLYIPPVAFFSRLPRRCQYLHTVHFTLVTRTHAASFLLRNPLHENMITVRSHHTAFHHCLVHDPTFIDVKWNVNFMRRLVNTQRARKWGVQIQEDVGVRRTLMSSCIWTPSGMRDVRCTNWTWVMFYFQYCDLSSVQ